ncbi:FAD dependent oxidoreductase [Aspergillus heterothallicus]
MELYRFLTGLLSSLPSPLVPLGLGRLAAHPTLLSPSVVAQTSPPEPPSTVILGAGVIGLSTAYYLALALNGTSAPKPPIVVIEPSHDVCPAASGEATGGLGDFGFSNTTSPLGELSYSLHKALAATYGGTRQYGFSDLAIYRVSTEGFGGNYSPPDSWGPAAPLRKTRADLPDWVRPGDDWVVDMMAEAPNAAHLDPRRFCHFLRDRCKELGVQFRFNAHATALARSPTSEHFTSVTIEQTTPCDPSSSSATDDPALAAAAASEQTSAVPSTQTEILPCNALVVAAGPWTPRVLSTLFPTSAVNSKLRMNKSSSHTAGNHLLIRNPHWHHDKDDAAGVTQVFFNNALPGGTRLDVTSFLGGYLYLGGWGAVPEELPGKADEIAPQPGEIEAMVELARRVLDLDLDSDSDLGSAERLGGDIEIVSAGRCYRPLAEPNRPVVTRVPWGWLGEEKRRRRHDDNHHGGGDRDRTSVVDGPVSPVIGGLYINTGHNSDGVTLGPGSGKLMSELLLGVETSVPAGDFGLENERLERL